jgi:5-methylcytosine-specific restriction endonuclease McrA
MPVKAPRVCGCGHRIVSGAACPCEERRARERKARHDKNRPSARARGYNREWERESKAFLTRSENRLCACGCGRVADMVDHITPHRGDERLFWDRSNWQPMASVPCHVSKKQRLERRQQKDF